MEEKLADSPSLKKMRAMTLGTRKEKEVLAMEKLMNLIRCNKRKRKEVLTVDNHMDLMGCITEESLAAYRTNFAVRLVHFPRRVDFSFFDTIEFNLRYLFQCMKLIDDLHMYPRLIQMFYADFYTPKPKNPLLSKCEIQGQRVRVIPNSTGLLFKLPKGSFEYYNTNQTAPVEGFDCKAALRQICKDPDFDVSNTPKTGELTILAHLIHVVDQRDNDDEDNEKGEGEDRLDIRIQENDSEVESAELGGYKPSINGDRDGDVVTLLRRMNETYFRTGGDVNADLDTLHKDMYSLMKRANEVAKKVESSRKITKKFIERLDPVVQESNKAPHDRMVRKNSKRKWTWTK
ncbi:hypothetical protein Scep_030013 [Stephania cephalantha]|uniref:Uncharacterized protein n=1 Tax=Stephania cephalantha TaxID=152367 RepID=A0AAP0E2D2_9MAGN